MAVAPSYCIHASRLRDASSLQIFFDKDCRTEGHDSTSSRPRYRDEGRAACTTHSRSDCEQWGRPKQSTLVQPFELDVYQQHTVPRRLQLAPKPGEEDHQRPIGRVQSSVSLIPLRSHVNVCELRLEQHSLTYRCVLVADLGKSVNHFLKILPMRLCLTRRTLRS